MKFAFVDGIRQEATTGVRGSCPGCGSPTLAKCGLKRLHHWAHVSTAACDRWWEPETEWHRAWKNLFPSEWQEVHHRAADGEVHIADVKTASGTVVEFQHSTISPQERASREAFYGSMIWIVDGTRLKRDLSSAKRCSMLRRSEPRPMPAHGCYLIASQRSSSAGEEASVPFSSILVTPSFHWPGCHRQEYFGG
ncbi:MULTISPECIES: competence protein CoiA [unclassified Rhizobium]|uniref:competence protein CoiA n=1 Tax=unclassified Rhizobium TaxID=2613769 RepID=UPI001F3C129A|nr:MULTISPECIES: competence protein CoiA family protein [unclassified Rhizobium]